MNVIDVVALATVVVAALAAVASFWAASETRKSAKATQNAAEAGLVAAFFDQYFDPSMAEALRILAALKIKGGEGFAAKWIDALKNGDPDANNADAARRKVKGFFHKATRLHFAGVIRATALRELVYVAGLNIYYDVIDPMELALNSSRSGRTVDLLKREFGRYSEAEHVQPVPPSRRSGSA